MEPPPHPIHTSTPSLADTATRSSVSPSASHNNLAAGRIHATRAGHSGTSSASSTCSRSTARAAPPPYLVIPNLSGTPNPRLTPPPFINLPSASHPSSPITPNSPYVHLPRSPTFAMDTLGFPGGVSVPCNPIAPHHYISSLRVASMRGTADMGGALVARIAAFLRTQYKSYANMPLKLPWCPKFT